MADTSYALAGQQAAVTDFGRFALTAQSIQASVERAVDVVARVLDVPLVALLESLGPGRVVVVHARGPMALAGEVGRPDGAEIAPPGLTAPLVVDFQPWGRLIVAAGTDRHFGRHDLAFVRSMADVLAAALERERVEAGRAFVAELSRYALQERDVELVTQRAVDVVTRVLEAPVGAVLRRTGRPGAMTLIQAWGPIGLEPGQEVLVDPAFDNDLAHDGPLLVEDGGVDPRRGVLDPGLTPDVVASLSLPVVVEGHLWGRLVVADTRPRRFTAAEVGIASAATDVLAAVLERDRIEHRLRRTAHDLQQSLAPAVPAVVPGLEIVARYSPAWGEEGGGDWYDVVALPQGGVGLVMGDVEGHDGPAAAVMGQVRNVLRAYAVEGHTPAEVMTKVNRFVARHCDRLVTCCYAELQSSAPSITWVSAGHPPPLVLAPGELVRALPGPPGLLLGLDESAGYEEITALLPAGAALMLVTDGLVEGPGAVHRGLDSFAEIVNGLRSRSTAELADALLRPGPAGQPDDAALLVVRLPGRASSADGGPLSSGETPAARAADTRAPGSLAQRVFRSAPESTPAARHFVRDVLAGWDLRHLEHSATLAVSELVTNTVLHTASWIHLTLRRTGRHRVWIGVYDDSDRFVRLRRPAREENSGRGLVIVETLADTWGVTRAADGVGKTVWLELTAGLPAAS